MRTPSTTNLAAPSNDQPQQNHSPNNNLPTLNNGQLQFPPRVRRLSNSSMASDVSFRLPSYDSPAVYHLQSDLDISASEIDEASVTPNAHLDLISKEHLHSAYKKSFERYQKYRRQYTELAKRYKDLERDNSKARVISS